VGLKRQSVTQKERRQQQADTDVVARTIIEQQRLAREAKTARLRALRAEFEAGRSLPPRDEENHH
jgi:hypothetical protein